jgi:hypothetical protein
VVKLAEGTILINKLLIVLYLSSEDLLIVHATVSVKGVSPLTNARQNHTALSHKLLLSFGQKVLADTAVT